MSLILPHKKKSIGDKFGERGGLATGAIRPIHRLGNNMSATSRALREKGLSGTHLPNTSQGKPFCEDGKRISFVQHDELRVSVQEFFGSFTTLASRCRGRHTPVLARSKRIDTPLPCQQQPTSSDPVEGHFKDKEPAIQDQASRGHRVAVKSCRKLTGCQETVAPRQGRPPWRSRLVCHRSGVREALGSNPGHGMGGAPPFLSSPAGSFHVTEIVGVAAACASYYASSRHASARRVSVSATSAKIVDVRERHSWRSQDTRGDPPPTLVPCFRLVTTRATRRRNAARSKATTPAPPPPSQKKKRPFPKQQSANTVILQPTTFFLRMTTHPPSPLCFYAPGKSAPINDNSTIVCANHIQFTQERKRPHIWAAANGETTPARLNEVRRRAKTYGGYKGYTDKRYKCGIAATRRALNWRAVFSSCVCLWDFQRRYIEVDIAIGSQFIRHALEYSEPIADLQRKHVASAIMPGLYCHCDDSSLGMYFSPEYFPQLQVGIVPDDAVGGGFSRGSPFSPAPSFRRCSIFTSIPSSALKTSLLRAAQISSLTIYRRQSNRTYTAGTTEMRRSGQCGQSNELYKFLADRSTMIRIRKPEF
ncbi:hypothetical protein PR048_029296 [Dryococelus australis]|uniref:Uncharacterized protein n=1 Tax=Dryococelus australis TaxID=614101 RepID=A0ABQ9GCZ7_9NEOP|nr:hypothetical protein PR048_029296 [Dryococelus australis]